MVLVNEEKVYKLLSQSYPADSESSENKLEFFSSIHGNLEDINDGIWSIVQHYDRFFPDYDFASKHDLHVE